MSLFGGRGGGEDPAARARREEASAAALRQMGRNTEMQNYTQALYSAHELALARMQAEAEAEQAQGIVGTQVRESNHGWGSHVIEFFAIGTAIKSISEDHQIASPTLVLPLDK